MEGFISVAADRAAGQALRRMDRDQGLTRLQGLQRHVSTPLKFSNPRLYLCLHLHSTSTTSLPHSDRGPLLFHLFQLNPSAPFSADSQHVLPHSRSLGAVHGQHDHAPRFVRSCYVEVNSCPRCHKRAWWLYRLVLHLGRDSVLCVRDSDLNSPAGSCALIPLPQREEEREGERDIECVRAPPVDVEWLGSLFGGRPIL